MNQESLPVFNSFVWGGYEGACAKFDDGRRIDIVAATKHDLKVSYDYRLLRAVGIQTVRESMGWSCVDNGGRYDFERYEQMMRAAQSEGIQQIWSLNHFDFPEGLSPFDDTFIDRFVSYSTAAVKLIRRYQKGTIYIIPMNEISFVSYMCGYVGAWAPYAKGRDNADKMKAELVRASIAAMNAIWRHDRNVRFIQVDPLFRRLPKEPITPGKMLIYNDYLKARLATFDMFAGRLNPELGGSSKHLDIIGCNYYITNQEWIAEDDFEADSRHREMLALNDPRRITLGSLLLELKKRYQRPFVITETGCYGILRPRWWKLILREVDESINQGIEIAGVCAYPVIDRPDWHDLSHLTNSGLWDFEAGDQLMRRIPHRPTIEIVKKYIAQKEAVLRARQLVSKV